MEKYEIINSKRLKFFEKYCFVEKNDRVIFLIRYLFPDNIEVQYGTITLEDHWLHS